MNSEIIQILACNNSDAFQHFSLIFFQQTHFNIQQLIGEKMIVLSYE
jgi:hypothetical protein